MKKSLLSPLLFLPLLLFVGTACDSDDLDDEGKPHNRKMTVTVASEKFIYDGDIVFLPNWVKEEDKTEWTRFENISGFEHEAGYECTLEIWREKWHDGEIMDVGIYRYKLLKVISKVKKDTEDFPDQHMSLEVASKKTSDPGNPYYAKFPGYTDWKPFPDIEGFVYEEGHEYYLRVKREFKGSDAPVKFTYSYVETVKDNEGNSTGLPM